MRGVRYGTAAAVAMLVWVSSAGAAFRPDPGLWRHAHRVAAHLGWVDFGTPRGAGWDVLWCKRRRVRKVTCLLREYNVVAATAKGPFFFPVYDTLVRVYRRRRNLDGERWSWRAIDLRLPWLDRGSL